ncbi:MAG: OstA-like protein [Rubricoccaceae bacterium]|nr:OstA-like protein [Rubricoccaceae bacterium]
MMDEYGFLRGWVARCATLLVLQALLTGPSRAQTHVVELIHASEVVVESDSVSGTVRRLSGDVRLRQDTIYLRSSRATHYVERGEVLMDGSVRIVAGDDTLNANRVTYDANEKVATAFGSVRISDGESVLLAPSALYYSRDKLAVFSEGGRILHDDAELTSPSGEYNTESKLATLAGPVVLRDSVSTLTAESGRYDAQLERADFLGSVRLVQDEILLEADSVSHFRETEVSEAFGHVVLERIGGAEEGEEARVDSTRRTILFGDEVRHDQSRSVSLVTGLPDLDPLVVRLQTDSTGATDSTFVRARRFETMERDTLEGRESTLMAVGNVRLFQDRLAALADSVSFVRFTVELEDDSSQADYLYLFGIDRPSVWFEDSQVSGDTLVGYAADEEIQRLDVFGNAFAAQFDSTLGRVRQLRGLQMRAILEDDSLRSLSVWPNAEAIHFRATADGLLDGADRLLADSLVFGFEDGRLADVYGARGVEGITYGPQIIPDPFRLSGYRYTPESRPTRASVLGEPTWETEWLHANPDFSIPNTRDGLQHLVESVPQRSP